MNNAIEKVVEILRERGYRVTAPRISVLAELLRVKQPQTISDLAQKVDADEASVYRTVRVLEEEGFVESIRLPQRSTTYAFADSHHHHLVCNKCERVVHIPCNEHGLKTPRHPDFKEVCSHEVMFYGRCKSCA